MKKIRAFSLLECLFSLLLVSFCTIGVLRFYNFSIRANNRALTVLKANHIRKVVEGYVAMHGFLPYAADSFNGIESDSWTIGYLPYKTLGIDKSYAYDGYGRPFIFLVNENLVLKYNKRNDFIVFPAFFPSVYFYPKVRTWNRLNLYKSLNSQKKTNSENCPMFLWDYDDSDINLNITLKKDGKEIELSSVKIYPIMDSEFLLKFSEEKQIETDRGAYLVNDSVAWCLISSKKFNLKHLQNKPIIIDINSYFLVFWQSRFNLASQIKQPMTTVATYIGFTTSNLIKSYFKHAKKAE